METLHADCSASEIQMTTLATILALVALTAAIVANRRIDNMED